MRKSVSNAVAGGLFTGAAMVGADGLSNDAEARTISQTRDFEIDFTTSALTCCFDANMNTITGFVFDGFRAGLGEDLDTHSATVTISGFDSNGAPLPCCDTLTIITPLVARGTFEGETFDPTQVFEDRGFQTIEPLLNPFDDLQTLDLQFVIDFGNQSTAFSQFASMHGSITLNYETSLSATPIPTPAALTLGTTSIFALMTASAVSRRRRKST